MALASKALPLSAVTVWLSPSMFITLTVAPGLTEAGTMNMKLLMWIIAVDLRAVVEAVWTAGQLRWTIWLAATAVLVGERPCCPWTAPRAASTPNAVRVTTAQARAHTARPDRSESGVGCKVVAGWIGAAGICELLGGEASGRKTGRTDRGVLRRARGRGWFAYESVAMPGRARPVVVVGDPVLHTATEPVTEFDDELALLIEDMFATMYVAEGVGLAAPRSASGCAVFVYDCPDDDDVRHKGHLVNPRIVATAGPEQKMDEGCLSVPGPYATLDRPFVATVAGQDLDGEPDRGHRHRLAGSLPASTRPSTWPAPSTSTT